MPKNKGGSRLECVCVCVLWHSLMRNALQQVRLPPLNHAALAVVRVRRCCSRRRTCPARARVLACPTTGKGGKNR
jgi:hypothetical protein